MSDSSRFLPHKELPHYTFQEARTAASGLANGPLRRGWTEIEGEAALRYSDGGPLELKFQAVGLVEWLGLPNSTQTLWAALRSLGLPAVLLYHVCLATLVEGPGPPRLSLDQLIKYIGWQPRSTSERVGMRRTVWRWLSAFDGWTIVGRRRGRYRDPLTRQYPDLWVDSSLFRIVERGFVEPEQLALDGSTPPFEVTLAAGPWLEQLRGRWDILSFFGDIRRIAAISAGKPSGAWAQAVGLALQQRWRERAADAEVGRVGEEKHPTVRISVLTRRDLLSLFPPSPGIESVLAGLHPGRAKTYWDEAIAALRDAGIIRYYAELRPLPASRQGWENEWLDQPLDVRPDEEGTVAIAEIARRAKEARRRAQRPAGRPGR